MPPTLPNISPCLDELDTYIGQSFSQIQFRECEPCLNSRFWFEYKAIHDDISRQLNPAVSAGTLTLPEYHTLLRVKMLSQLFTLGWRGFYNTDGCVEFVNIMVTYIR